MDRSLKKLMFVVIFLMILLVACQANVSDQSTGDGLFSLTRASRTGVIFDNRKTQNRVLIDGSFEVRDGTNYFFIMLIYDQKGMFFDFSGEGKDFGGYVRLCPQAFYANRMILWDLTIESFNEAVESNPEFTFPNVFDRTIDMISSDTIALFTEKMIDINHLGCIDISKEKWGWNN